LIGITLEVVLDKAFWQRVATPDNPNMNFQLQHISTLAKYAGISFIAGAVNHGMFSENRSYATAAVGVLFFLVGSFIEKQASIHGAKSWGDLLGFGIVASIGLGFFTGGLQHFPDSPDRSIWVVPLGFFLSLIALYMTEGKENISLRSFVIYGLVAGAVVVLGSVASFDLIWTIADILNGLMAIPNLISLLLLSGTVFQLTRSYDFKANGSSR